MKNKVLSIVLAGTMMSALISGCGGAAETASPADTGSQETKAAETAEAPAETPALDDYGSGDIKIWVADNVVDFTKEYAEKFLSDNAQFSGYTVTVEPVGEGYAVGNMIIDVTAGADIFGFAQDQIARLVSAGALIDVEPGNAATVKAENSAGVVTAATVGDTLYAYPMTADNGYFLYYDKSVISDPSTLEGIIADCEAAGKNFYMDLGGWYNVAFFFGTGCTLTYDTDDEGNFTACDINYDSDAGLTALKAMVKMTSSKSFQQGSSAGDAVNYAAIVDGTWDAGTIQEVLGDNYACAKLPTFTGDDGKTYQMSGFNGCKLLGVKPQEDEGKLAVCDALALYLTSEEVQLARYNAVGWGPSNIAAQNSSDVQADPALSALSEQFAYTIPQGNYPGDYWTLAESLRDSVIGEYQSADDATLKAALKSFQDSCLSYVK